MKKILFLLLLISSTCFGQQPGSIRQFFSQNKSIIPPPSGMEWTPNANYTITGSGLIATASNADVYSVNGSVGRSSGKYYAEVKYTATITNSTTIGIRLLSEAITVHVGSTNDGYSINDVGQKKHNDVDAGYAATPVLNDIIGILINLDDNEISFRVNNTDVGVAYTGITPGTYYIAAGSGFAANQFTLQNTLTYGVPPTYTQW